VTIDSDSARFTRVLKRAILLPVGVIFLTAVLLTLFSLELFRVITLSDRSYQVIVQTSTCQKSVLDLETGVRGYIVRANPLFLEPYNQALPQIDDNFARLKELVHDNPDQEKKVDDLIKAKNLWLDFAKSSISQAQQGVVPPGDWNVMGKNLMDDVRAKFDSFLQVEYDLQAGRRGEVRNMKRAFGFAGAGLAFVLALVVGYTVRRQFINLASGYRTALTTVEQRNAELVRSEGDLEEQKEWFRVTLTSIGDGVVVTDPEGRVVFMNHEAERLTGWTSVEALLQPLPTIFRIVNEDTRAKVEDPVEKVFREKKVVGLANHTLLISRAGQECPIEDSAAPIQNAGGRMLGVVLVFHDATEMRHAQKELKVYSHDLEQKVTERTTTLQQAFSELEAFSYTVSHDLRSPLRAMQGFSQAVIEDYGDKLDERGKGYLDRIKNAAERLDHLIQDLLTYTRISRQEAPLVEIDLDRMVREIIELYPNLHAPEANIQVEGTLPKIWGKEAALTQALSNLLGNAVKFMAPDVVPQVRVRSEERGSVIRVWIEDNGIGMAPEDLERIFQMFVQVNEQQLYGGTGIGLAIVKRAVQAMQGEIGVESEPGKGSRFWIELARQQK
jgi:PAS domain S-box-containing protein